MIAAAAFVVLFFLSAYAGLRTGFGEPAPVEREARVARINRRTARR